MGEELKHWRMGSKITHSGVEVLPQGKPIDITISRIEWKDQEEVGGSKKDGFVAYSNELKLPIFLNSTNKKRLVKMFNTEYLETLKNIRVTLCAEKTRDPQDGGDTMGLRISKIKPSQSVKSQTGKGETVIKPALEQGSEKWDAIVGWLLEKPENTVAGIEVRYQITDDTREVLKKKKEENG